MTTGLPHVLRRRERILMTSRCDVTRGTHPNLTLVHTNLPCIVTPSQRATRTVEVGGQQVTLHLYDVTVPIEHNSAATDIRLNDVATVTQSQDARLVGLFLTVVEVLHDDFVTNRRFVAVKGGG